MLWFVGVSLFGLSAAWVPSELVNATTPSDVYEILSQTNSKSLIESLPIQLQGPNMTLANVQKWYNLTLTSSGPASPSVSSHLLGNGSFGVDPMDLVNLFATVWNFVKDNKGQANIQAGQYAGAVPRGVSWSSVTFNHGYSTWGSAAQPWVNSWTNGFGVECAVLHYGWMWYAHGTYGSGTKYMDQATQIIFKADAGWGQTLNAKSTNSKPVNVGSYTNPNAAITFQIDADANGCHDFRTFVLRGDGSGHLVNYLNGKPELVAAKPTDLQVLV